jgi:hypothetical protein
MSPTSSVTGMGEFLDENPLVLVIGACEVGFWVLLGPGSPRATCCGRGG